MNTDKYYTYHCPVTHRVFVYETGVDGNFAEIFARNDNETVGDNAELVCAALNKHRKTLTITINYDQDYDSPEQYTHWEVYSFNPRHVNFKHPDKIKPDENVIVLSYYEHGSSAWFRRGVNKPGVEFNWDGRRNAGVLIWKGSDEPDMTRADKFLEEYTGWWNGDVYYYVIEDNNGDTVDSCGGFIGDPDHMLNCIADAVTDIGVDIEDITVQGVLSWCENDLHDMIRERRMQK